MLSDFNPPFGIIGMGRSGQAVLRLFESLDMKSQDYSTFDDVKGVAQFNDPEVFIKSVQPKTLIVAPGYPLATNWLIEAKKKNIQIINELTLASYFLKEEKIIGITGSMGKSTVVGLLSEGVSAVTKNFFVGGNFGTPFCDYIQSVVTKKQTRADWIILELSSYHLENLKNLSLDYSAITYLTGNHLERYPSKEKYYDTKWNILKYTVNNLFINKYGGEVYSYANDHWDEKIIISDRNSSLFNDLNLTESLLIGQHNHDNLALAILIAKSCGWEDSAISAMKKFRGLPHRLENIGMHRGVRFINDSKSTTVESVLTAITATIPSLSDESQIHLLVGGKDKDLPWENLGKLESTKNLNFYFFGQCGKLAKTKSNLKGDVFLNLKDAIMAAFNCARSNDTILLSPGGTSFDEFKNFEERGNYFKNLALKL